MSNSPPVVLCFSGHDPSGGAGIQADIEALISHRCHAASVITALTEQDTHNVKNVIPQNAEDVLKQAQTVLHDLPVKAFKVGLMGHFKIAEAVLAILKQHPNIPVVLDTVLAAGGGAPLGNSWLIANITDLLMPYVTVLTPNSQEARKLTGLNDLQECGLALLKLGAKYVLITGTHEATSVVINRLFHDGKLWETYTYDRLPHSYHGSGCTLASSIAAFIAQGLEPVQAIYEAQEYTWNTLNAAYQPGTGQHNPNRFFWMDDE
jgi:hydroxymethylpyrimidine/phosphomethylpyrimidine kinase